MSRIGTPYGNASIAVLRGRRTDGNIQSWGPRMPRRPALAKYNYS
jgi:hypothetical protein